MSDYKVIHDSVHGSVRIGGVYLRLLERPEMQRLHGVHQLGLAHLVFPGANHTRLEHSLGTFFVANRMVRALSLDEEEMNEVLAAALLHDLGHPPYSHTLESVIENHIGKNHMEVTRDIIIGKQSAVPPRLAGIIGDMRSIPELLEDAGISPARVGDLIAQDRLERVNQRKLMIEGNQVHFDDGEFLRSIIHGPVDADQIDYLLRDAHYTGVAHGTIDVDRIMETIQKHHGKLVVHKSGVVAIEGLLVARALMYTSVYFHKTVRIAEMMLCKAVELAGSEIMERIHQDTDCTLSQKLMKAGGRPAELITMMNYRILYKKAFSIRTAELDDDMIESLLPLTDYQKRKAKEAEIADRAGLDISEVILDVPSKELMLSEPRIGKTEVPILDGDRVRPLSKYSPLAKALQYRPVHDWAVMVSCPKRHVERVSRVAPKVLF